MKKFKEYLKEAAPTNSGGNPQAYSNAADVEGPVAGFDKKLFPSDIDLLDQGYQTPAEPGLSKWARWSNVYPVMKVSLSSNLGDGPSIDAMVRASSEYTHIMDTNVQDRIKKQYSKFMGESKEDLTCPVGMKYDKKLKSCVPIKSTYHGRWWGGGRHHEKTTNGNGSGNGNSNGNANGNGHGGNGNGNGGTGSGGNGGGNGGGGGT